MSTSEADGSLKLISQPVVAVLVNATAIFQGSGLSLLPRSRVTFTYSGTVALGSQPLSPKTYQITVVSGTVRATFALPLG